MPMNVLKNDASKRLLNLRGSDISYSPVFFSYAIVTLKKVVLFIDKQKITPEVSIHLKGVDVQPYNEVIDYIETLGQDPKAKIWITQYCSYALRMVIPKGRSVTDESPIAFPKAVKNYVEVEGMKKANITPEVSIHLKGVDVQPYNEVIDYIETLGQDPKAKIWITQYCSYALRMVIPKGRSVTDESPIAFPKAVKNYVEVEGMKKANVTSEFLNPDSSQFCNGKLQNLETNMPLI
ncbi:Xaa-Pro aminopeptidase 1 [Exaiptasia diaphana]|nr:Xaa-Pro aminopeptidase 1 [Exaiptasia diaphana]